MFEDIIQFESGQLLWLTPAIIVQPTHETNFAIVNFQPCDITISETATAGIKVTGLVHLESPAGLADLRLLQVGAHVGDFSGSVSIPRILKMLLQLIDPLALKENGVVSVAGD